MKLKKIAYFTLAVVLVISFFVSTAIAAEFRVAKKGGNTAVDQDETVKNLYTAGNIVSINGDIEKSLYVVGNVISVNSDVEGTIHAGGGTIVIRGNVGDSIHAGGGSILIEGIVEEDVFIGGGNITISKTASIKGDLIIGGGTVDIQGPVAGNLYLGAGQAIINSKIGGQVKAKVDEFKLGSEAEIVGDLNYTSSEEAEMAEGAVVLGKIDFKVREFKKIDIARSPKTLFGILTLAFLLKLLISIAAGLVLVYLFRDVTKQVVKESLTSFWGSLGRGFSALILIPVLCLILLITVIGIWIAGILASIYGLMMLLASALASVAFGSWLIKVIKKQSKYSIGWPAVVWGVISLKIIILIPYIGWLVGLVFMLISLGALYRLFFQNLVSVK